jgi:hypothetical protein
MTVVSATSPRTKDIEFHSDAWQRFERAVDVVAKSPDARKARVREMFRSYDLIDLEGAGFQRLLRLAHDEGLLLGFLREIGALDRQGRYRYSDALGCPQRIEDQSIPLLRPDHQYSRTAAE